MKLTRLISAFLFVAITSMVLASVTGVPSGWVMTGLSVLSLAPMPSGVAMMAITKEIWINDIVGNLFKANPHLNFAMNTDAFVLQGKVVHMPNAGAKPTVEKNRSTLPATVVLRTDVDIYFPLDEFSSDPMLITNAEKYELSYDKRQSVIGEQSAAIAETVGDWFFYYWAAKLAAQMKRTSGAAVSAHVGTGNRKLVTLADVKQMAKLFNSQNIPQQDRFACLDADLYDQFTDSLTATQYRDFSMGLDAGSGMVGKLFGFTFLNPRSSVLTYNNAATPVPYTPAQEPEAATANAAGLFWQKDSVIRALGQNDFFEDLANPTYYGDIYSALVRAGGRIRRNDGYGVAALIQAAEDYPA